MLPSPRPLVRGVAGALALTTPAVLPLAMLRGRPPAVRALTGLALAALGAGVWFVALEMAGIPPCTRLL